jgi:hypothetical protein
MKLLTASIFVTALLFPRIVAAQIKTLPGESITFSGTIETIEKSSRSITLRGPKGNLLTMHVPPEVKSFDTMKVGDTINAKYYENVVLRLKKPEEPDVNTNSDAVTRGTGAKPAGTAASQRIMTVKITAIDPQVPSITLAGPNNWTYSSRVADKAALAQVKVGDRLDITWTDAVVMSLDSAKTK